VLERDISRLDLMRQGLERDLAAAVSAEARAGIDALIREGRELQARSHQLRDRYAKVAAELAAVLLEMQTGYRRFEQLRRPIEDAGRLADLCPEGEASIYDAVAHIVLPSSDLKLVNAVKGLSPYWPRRAE
jgi:hypothetical protein